MHIHNVLVAGEVDARFSDLPSPHVPDLATLEGALDLFSLCTFAELGEFLDPTAYRRQHRDDRELEHDRRCEIYTRGAARDLLDFWHCQFMVVNSGLLLEGPAIFKMLFAHHVKVLIAYKELAEKKGMETIDPACTAEAFRTLVHKYLPDIHRAAPLPGSSSENFSWPTAGLNIDVTSRGLKKEKKQMSSESTPYFIHPT